MSYYYVTSASAAYVSVLYLLCASLLLAYARLTARGVTLVPIEVHVRKRKQNEVGWGVGGVRGKGWGCTRGQTGKEKSRTTSLHPWAASSWGGGGRGGRVVAAALRRSRSDLPRRRVCLRTAVLVASDLVDGAAAGVCAGGAAGGAAVGAVGAGPGAVDVAGLDGRLPLLLDAREWARTGTTRRRDETKKRKRRS